MFSTRHEPRGTTYVRRAAVATRPSDLLAGGAAARRPPLVASAPALAVLLAVPLATRPW